MRVFLSIKFWGDDRNQQDVEQICQTLERTGADVFCFRRDAELWGDKHFTPSAMMEMVFREIDQSDLLVANVAHWPIGVGVEAGYAFGRQIPVLCICPISEKIANTVAGVASEIIHYKDYDELCNRAKSFIASLPCRTGNLHV